MWRVMFKNKKKEINVLVKRVHFPYANKILNSQRSLFPTTQPEHSSTIAGSGWFNFSIISGIVKMLHGENELTAALLLNNIIWRMRTIS